MQYRESWVVVTCRNKLKITNPFNEFRFQTKRMWQRKSFLQLVTVKKKASKYKTDVCCRLLFPTMSVGMFLVFKAYLQGCSAETFQVCLWWGNGWSTPSKMCANFSLWIITQWCNYQSKSFKSEQGYITEVWSLLKMLSSRQFMTYHGWLFGLSSCDMSAI
jgi:hypothetical protein